MALPLRKDRLEDRLENEEDLTTADLAQRARREPTESSESHLQQRPDEIGRQEFDRQVLDPDNPDERFGPRPVSSDRKAEERKFQQRAATQSAATGSAALFPAGELDSLRARWKEVQTGFVDEPRRAVEQADGLVASAMKRLAEVFAEERSNLEKQWDQGESVSTEDLRVALQRYRAFFDRLLSV